MTIRKQTEFDVARDELMSHIHRCGVLKASEEHQTVWFADTIEYLTERYAGLTSAQFQQLEEIGKRFCKPIIRNGAAADEGKLVGAA